MGKGFKQADYKQKQKQKTNRQWKYARILNPIHNYKTQIKLTEWHFPAIRLA